MVYNIHRWNICRYFKWLLGKTGIYPFTMFQISKTSRFKFLEWLLCSLINHLTIQIIFTFYLVGKKKSLSTLQQLINLKMSFFFFLVNEWSISPLIRTLEKMFYKKSYSVGLTHANRYPVGSIIHYLL